jgi:hypothetical protein
MIFHGNKWWLSLAKSPVDEVTIKKDGNFAWMFSSSNPEGSGVKYLIHYWSTTIQQEKTLEELLGGTKVGPRLVTRFRRVRSEVRCGEFVSIHGAHNCIQQDIAHQIINHH